MSDLVTLFNKFDANRQIFIIFLEPIKLILINFCYLSKFMIPKLLILRTGLYGCVQWIDDGRSLLTTVVTSASWLQRPLWVRAPRGPSQKSRTPLAAAIRTHVQTVLCLYSHIALLLLFQQHNSATATFETIRSNHHAMKIIINTHIQHRQCYYPNYTIQRWVEGQTSIAACA